jgi:hypothetical protein
MKNLNKIAVMLAAAALAACLFPMCLPSEQQPGEDAWAKVTSLEQLDGTWAWSAVKTVPLIEQMESIWDSDMERMVGADAKVTVTMTGTVIINAAAKTYGGDQTQTHTYSGGNTAANWAVIRSAAERAYTDFGFTPSIDDSEHTVTASNSFDPSPIGSDVDSFLAKFEINRDGTKFRQPAAGVYPELIYTRQ